jgi:hypothetical protein
LPSFAFNRGAKCNLHFYIKPAPKPITFSYAPAVTNYRRNFICGGSFFFTANLAERRLRLLVDYIDLLRQAFRYVRRRHPFDIVALTRRRLRR